MTSRWERNLGQSRQEKIKNIPAPPTRSDGKDGDMSMYGGILYIKMNAEWHQFNPVPKSTGAEEKPYDHSNQGYEILSSGLMIQWGYGTFDNDFLWPILFPKQFPNTCFGAFFNHKLSGNAGTGTATGYPLTILLYTVAGFIVDRHDDADGNVNFNYIAIGN